MMEGNSELDLSEYRVISIEDNHKLAIVHLLNSIIPDPPMLEDLNDTKNVIWKLGSLIDYFEKSFVTGQNVKIPATLGEEESKQISSIIRNWLVSYYNADSVIGMNVIRLNVIRLNVTQNQSNA